MQKLMLLPVILLATLSLGCAELVSALRADLRKVAEGYKAEVVITRDGEVVVGYECGVDPATRKPVNCEKVEKE